MCSYAGYVMSVLGGIGKLSKNYHLSSVYLIFNSCQHVCLFFNVNITKGKLVIKIKHIFNSKTNHVSFGRRAGCNKFGRH